MTNKLKERYFFIKVERVKLIDDFGYRIGIYLKLGNIRKGFFYHYGK